MSAMRKRRFITLLLAFLSRVAFPCIKLTVHVNAHLTQPVGIHFL